MSDLAVYVIGGLLLVSWLLHLWGSRCARQDSRDQHADFLTERASFWRFKGQYDKAFYLEQRAAEWRGREDD